MKTRSLITMTVVGLMIIGQGFVGNAFARGPMMTRSAAAATTTTSNTSTATTTTTDTTAASSTKPAGMPDHGPGHGPMDGPGHAPIDVLSGEAVTITGTVTEVTSGERMKDEIKINTGSEIVAVCGLGPVNYWTDSGYTFPVVGNTVSVDGYKVTAPDNTQIIIASKVTIGDKQIQLIDTTTGKPMWDGMRPAMALTGDAVTITGTVSEVDVETMPARPDCAGKPGKSGMTATTTTTTTTATTQTEVRAIKVDNGTETVTIFGLGPAAYWEGLGVAMPKAGDSITVNGLSNTFMGTDKIVALSITINGQTVQLVDSATNRPLWMKTSTNPT